MARALSTGGKPSARSAGKARSIKGSKAAKTKRRPTGHPAKRTTVETLSEELAEAREQQAATAEILKVIASSPNDVQPVFEAIAASAKRLMGGHSAAVFRFIDGVTYLEAFTPTTPEADEVLKNTFPMPVANFPLAQRNVLNGETDQIEDTETGEGFQVRLGRARGFRSIMFSPLMHQGTAIGMISITRCETGLFADHHVKLLRSFADQAVIAIENSRLFNETKKVMERQAAMSDILKVIASSPDNVQPVFDAIAQSAKGLFAAHTAVVTRVIGDMIHLAAFTSGNPAGNEALQRSFPFPLSTPDIHTRVLRTRAVEFRTDILTEPNVPPGAKIAARARGYRSILVVPMLREGDAIGTIVVTRPDPGPFSKNEIELLQTFADHAVIAIENVRLFNETKEALERQTATAEILKVIASSPSDVQPVFDAIAASVNRLVGGFSASVILFIDGMAYLKASTSITIEADEMLNSMFPRPLADFPPARIAPAGEIMQVPDTEAVDDDLRDLARARGFRSVVFVPLMNKRAAIGVIGIARLEAGPFAEHHLQLLQAFADQAVIAIENTRLFNEVQAKTRDLEESLQRQTATADVLKIISRSAFDLSTVMNTLARSALDLCGSKTAALFFREGDMLVARGIAAHEIMDEQFVRSNPAPLNDESHMGRAVLTGTIANIGDFENNPHTKLRKFQQLMGFKSFLAVPLMREGRGVGVFALTRDELGPFSERQVELVQGFADQAVIAIENARLFNETKEALARQTATSDVLKVIASSPSSLQPVFDSIAERSRALIGAHSTVVVRYIDGMIHLAAFTPVSPEADAAIQAMFGVPRPPVAGDPQTERVLRGEIAFITDAETELQGNVMLEAARARGWRSRLLVPLKDDTGVIGWISITRKEAGGFAEKDVELLQTFADQAVIAIKNVELFEEVQARTRDLQESLNQQTATSEVLQVISSSPGDLGPVFDKMLENATRVCGAEFGSMVLVEGDTVLTAATFNAPPAFVEARAGVFMKVHPKSAMAAAIRTRQVVQVEDYLRSPAFLERNPISVQFAELSGARTILVVPMLRENDVIGLIIAFRQEVHLFGDKQIDLLTNFARQAVIAIENARLLRELRQRTDELTEALVYQTGSSNILKVIASSPTDVGPALQAIVESACEICDANDAVALMKDANDLRISAHHGTLAVSFESRQISRQWVIGRAVVDRVTLHVADLLGPEGDEFAESKEISRKEGYRTVLGVPLLRDGEAIGVICLRRTEVQPFNDKQIDLLKSFADQAVIAISNVRLFEQVQERTRELSKSLDDLRTAQDRLIQTEKLASLGQLTAGIAHEIKNPLNFVNNFSALSVELTDELNDLLKQAALADQLRKEVDDLAALLKSNLEKVVQHGKRADSIVKNMLLHSRQGSGERRSADINALVDESLNLAYHGARAEKQGFNITMERDLDPEAGAAEIYPQEITRAFLNLISNGFYAATQRPAANGFEPRLTTATRNLGDKVEIRIRDNGMGIPPDIREKIFNPFFTTKPAGEGTGLGLSMSHDIVVKQHGGTIEVLTEPGSFTEFIITLPRVLP